jgi:hypothetical protein
MEVRMGKNKGLKANKEKPRLWKGANPVSEMYQDWKNNTQKISELFDHWVKDEICEKRFVFEMLLELKNSVARRQEYRDLAGHCVPGFPETDPDFPG